MSFITRENEVHELSEQSWYTRGDRWVLTQTGRDQDSCNYYETIFSQANGYMGFRAYPEEQSDRGISLREGYLAGIFAEITGNAKDDVLKHPFPWPAVEMVTLPEIFSVCIKLADEEFSMDEGDVLKYTRELNMRNGLLKRKVMWKSPKGKMTQLTFERFLSSDIENLAVMRVSVTPIDWEGCASVKYAMECEQPTKFRCGDPKINGYEFKHLKTVSTLVDEHHSQVILETNGTHHQVVVSVGGDESLTHEAVTDSLIQQADLVQVKANETVSYERFVSIVTSRDEIEYKAKYGKKVIQDAVVKGFEKVLSESEKVWEKRWDMADVVIEGNTKDQMLARYSMFSLMQMAPFHTDKVSVPARGFAYNRYNGLYFWDGEIFLVPFYAAALPEVARNMLRFRYHTLDGARKTANYHGAKGACFPWQGDSEYGAEQGPWGIWEFLWHQTADIVYAIDQYLRSSGDHEFLVNEAADIFVETARFWCSKLELEDDGLYHVHKAVGPDEFEADGKDNGYTAILSRHNLRVAVKWLERLGDEHAEEYQVVVNRLELEENEIDQWRDVASKVCVKDLPGHSGIPMQDSFLLEKKLVDVKKMTVDEFWETRHQVRVIKQADIILAMFLLEDEFTNEQMKEAYEFYEPLTLHVSSLSYNTHSMVAARLCDMDQAYDYYQRAAGLDLDNIRNATKDGLHAAAHGGTWQMLVRGFAGLVLHNSKLEITPRLPKQWKSMQFKYVYRGWVLTVRIEEGSTRIKVDGEGDCNAVISRENYCIRLADHKDFTI
ncbi:glycoside hydrolase family 65 protein [Planctomycetota bacterium]|nr:glycoside hydrolase family 65 protein [Planctomycetota bacterium]